MGQAEQRGGVVEVDGGLAGQGVAAELVGQEEDAETWGEEYGGPVGGGRG